MKRDKDIKEKKILINFIY